jgi:ribosome maturation factor RimP
VEGGGDVQEKVDELEQLVASTCAALHLDLYDFEVRSASLIVTVDRADGLDLDAVTDVARVLSAALDEYETIVPANRYELEVSTPGLERELRKPQHFASAIGSEIAVRLLPGLGGQRRFEAMLVAVDDQGIEISVDGTKRVVEYGDIERAHTIFDWKAALASPRGTAEVVEDVAESDGLNDVPFDEEVEMTKEQA